MENEVIISRKMIINNVTSRVSTKIRVRNNFPGRTRSAEVFALYKRERERLDESSNFRRVSIVRGGNVDRADGNGEG